MLAGMILRDNSGILIQRLLNVRIQPEAEAA
jgi:hypothetical protein